MTRRASIDRRLNALGVERVLVGLGDGAVGHRRERCVERRTGGRKHRLGDRPRILARRGAPESAAQQQSNQHEP